MHVYRYKMYLIQSRSILPRPGGTSGIYRLCATEGALQNLADESPLLVLATWCWNPWNPPMVKMGKIHGKIHGNPQVRVSQKSHAWKIYQDLHQYIPATLKMPKRFDIPLFYGRIILCVNFEAYFNGLQGNRANFSFKHCTNHQILFEGMRIWFDVWCGKFNHAPLMMVYRGNMG